MSAESAALQLRLSVQFAVRSEGLPATTTIRRWLRRALRRSAMLTVRFVGVAEGRRLNKHFRGRDYATNVLTFSYEEQPALRRGGRAALSGDIALCVPVLRREARAQNKTLRAHCAHLAIHGALHLQGYDHQTAKDAKVMEMLETKLLASLRYGDPYAPHEGKKKQER